MLNSVSNIKPYNYNMVALKKSNTSNVVTSSFTSNSARQPVLNIRTELTTKIEKQKYNELLKNVDKTSRKQLDLLLKNGVLLNSNSNDNSTVLDNLHNMIINPRAEGLNAKNLLKDTISTISYPFVITQQFGDIPDRYRKIAISANQNDAEIDVEHSGTCVAASIEFNMAEQMPAEFARFAERLSSPDLQVKKEIKLSNLSDDVGEAISLLNIFNIPNETNNFNTSTLTFAPDKNAIIRAVIQTTDRDPLERSPLDVLMQSTFMQVGSQQSYNTLTDKRAKGEFNQNDKGLVEYEKTFVESVVEDKNKMSVVYQTVDDNARLIGYETDKETLKKQLVDTLNSGSNIIVGYTQVDNNNIIINGHEITIIGYKYDSNNKLIFICNDTDDDISKPIEYGEDYLLPKIHHAGLPQKIASSTIDSTPNWVVGLEMYKNMRNGK